MTLGSISERNLLGQVEAALNAGVPLIAIETSEPASTEKLLSDEFLYKLIRWDIVDGLQGLDEGGQNIVSTLGERERAATANHEGAATRALMEAQKFSSETMFFFHNAHRQMEKDSVVQAIWNLRDQFKKNSRYLVMLGPSFNLPDELRGGDVLVLEHPRPDRGELSGIVQHTIHQAELVVQESEGDDFKFAKCREQISEAVDSLLGTNSYAAEQLTAMALRHDGFAFDQLRNQARKMIEQTRGLSFEKGNETFEDIGGMEAAKTWSWRLFKGPAAPAVVVRIEELEKTMSASGSDLTGTSQDQLQVLLSAFEDNDWDGLIAYGIPGSGKSLLGKAMANTFGAKALYGDMSACKGSLLGQSEQYIRAWIDILKTIGGSKVFFIASCNSIAGIPPELRRRFRSGVWFFDAPEVQQRRQIWKLHFRKYGHEETSLESVPDEEGLTGADIRNICEQAWKLGITLKEARKYAVPLKQTAPEKINDCRKQAHNRFWCVNTGDVYRLKEA